MAKHSSKRLWQPDAGKYASYEGRHAKLLKFGKTVLVVAEASNCRTVVRSIGRKGMPVNFTVLTSNLAEPQPSLFD